MTAVSCHLSQCCRVGRSDTEMKDSMQVWKRHQNKDRLDCDTMSLQTRKKGNGLKSLSHTSKPHAPFFLKDFFLAIGDEDDSSFFSLFSSPLPPSVLSLPSLWFAGTSGDSARSLCFTTNDLFFLLSRPSQAGTTSPVACRFVGEFTIWNSLEILAWLLSHPPSGADLKSVIGVWAESFGKPPSQPLTPELCDVAWQLAADVRQQWRRSAGRCHSSY